MSIKNITQQGFYTVMDAYEVVFWIRATSDARIALTTVAGLTSARSVEIQIGIDNNLRYEM